ncbi:hypothetical protein FRB90_005793 [Tulasnella sp. 427]|nr:hypothetical protein FRB90_005793 [Tulasnella sp. 427]
MVAQALTNLTAPNLEAVSLETPRQLRSDVVFKWNEIPSASMTPLPSVRSLFVTDRPMPASLHQDQFAMFLSRIFPRIEEMEIVALGCRPLLTTWAEHFDVAPNGWRDLRSLVLEYEDFKCVGSPQEILRETLRFLDVRRKVPENAPLEWVQIGVCEECMWTVKDALLNGMKRVVRSKEDLQIAPLYQMDSSASTILTIPPEITISIFEHLLLAPSVGRSPYRDLLPVTQASSQLRSTALSAPSLWSTIEITDKPASFNFAKLCLSRSGNHKLDISIRVLRKAESKMPGLLALLQYASTRIRCLSLRLSFANPKEWSAWCDSFKLLELVAMESFTFEAWRRESIAEGQLPPRSVFTLSEAMCSIKSLALAHTSVPPDTPALSGLLRLRISSSTFWAWPYQQLLDVLQSCQALEELELHGDGMNVAYGAVAPDNLPLVSRIHCPNLRRITLFRVENSIPALILVNLTAPSLEFLSLEAPKFLREDCKFTWINPPKVIPFDSARTLAVRDGPGESDGSIGSQLSSPARDMV